MSLFSKPMVFILAFDIVSTQLFAHHFYNCLSAGNFRCVMVTYILWYVKIHKYSFMCSLGDIEFRSLFSWAMVKCACSWFTQINHAFSFSQDCFLALKF